MAECKAEKCRICGGEHNYSLCDHDGGEQKMFNIREEGDKDVDKDQQDPNNGEADKQAENDSMYQQEADEAFEEPGDDEFVDDTEDMWTLMEFGEENQESSDIEESQVEDFWSMINSETDKISPSIAIQKLANVEIDATKDASQKRKIAEVAQDSSATETGLASKKSREEIVTNTVTGLLNAIRPLEQNSTLENKTDAKPMTAKKELTWTKVLTAAFPKKTADWAKNTFTQKEWKMIIQRADNPENEKYSTMEPNQGYWKNQ